MDTQDDEEVFLTTRQVMEILGCSRQNVSKLRVSGLLSTYLKGNQHLVSATEVKALLIKRNTVTKIKEATNHG